MPPTPTQWSSGFDSTSRTAASTASMAVPPPPEDLDAGGQADLPALAGDHDGRSGDTGGNSMRLSGSGQVFLVRLPRDRAGHSRSRHRADRHLVRRQRRPDAREVDHGGEGGGGVHPGSRIAAGVLDLPGRRRDGHGHRLRGDRRYAACAGSQPSGRRPGRLGLGAGRSLDQDGEPWGFCTRSFLKRQAGRRRVRVRDADDVRARVVRRDGSAGPPTRRPPTVSTRPPRQPATARGGETAGRIRRLRRADPPRVLARPDGGVGCDRRPAGRRGQLRRHPPRHPQRLAGHGIRAFVCADGAGRRPRQRLPPPRQPVAGRPQPARKSIPTGSWA